MESDSQPMEIEVKEQYEAQRIISDQKLTFYGRKLRLNQLYTVELVRNSSDPQYFEHLLKLMNLYEESLPNMKTNQIYSYVFSNQNQKLLLLRNDQLQGGLCFKNVPKRYSQIQLMAVIRQKRNKGNGSLLMSALKHLLQLRRINLLVTNADSHSLQFYYKHGFSEQEYIKNHIWSNRYQQFSFSTKLQCLIFPNINYFILRDKLKEQKAYMQTQLNSYSLLNHQPYEVTTPSQTSLYTHIQGSKEEYFLVNPLQIPGLDQSEWSWYEYQRQKQMKETKNYRSFGRVFKKIFEKAEPQLKKMDEIIMNSEIVFKIEPCDLQPIFEKIKTQKYQNAQLFFQEIQQFFTKAADFYKANQRVIANLSELRQILEAQKSILAKFQVKHANEVKL